MSSNTADTAFDLVKSIPKRPRRRLQPPRGMAKPGERFDMAKRTCSIAGCDRKHRAHGWCAVHYNDKRLKGELPERPCVEQRFWANVDKSGGPDECWPWTGAVDAFGYGRFWRGSQHSRRAHRIAYEFTAGNQPDGLQVDHRCWNHTCCNPAHLRVATHAENQQNRQGASRRSRTGIRGVVEEWRDGRVYWSARVQHHGKSHHVGRFDSPESAGEAARLKRLELFTHNEADR